MSDRNARMGSNEQSKYLEYTYYVIRSGTTRLSDTRMIKVTITLFNGALQFNGIGSKLYYLFIRTSILL